MPSCRSKRVLHTSGSKRGKTNMNGEVLKRTSKLEEVMSNKYLFALIYACHETWKYRDAHKRRMKPVLTLIKKMGGLYQQILDQDKKLITDKAGNQIIGFSDLRKIISTIRDLPPKWDYSHKVLFSVKIHIIKITTKEYTIASTIAQSEADPGVFWIDYIKFYGWFNHYNMSRWNIFLKEWSIRYDHTLRRYVFI